MTFDQTNFFKIYETPDSQIYRNIPIQGITQQQGFSQNVSQAGIELQCPQCKTNIKLQAHFKKGVPLKLGVIKMPSGNKIECPNCKNEIDLVDLKKNIEGQARRKIVYDNEKVPV